MNRAPENNGKNATPCVPSQGTVSIEAQLDEAVDHHRAGRLFKAEEIYRRILVAEPDYPYALCLLGTIAQAAGENDQAVELISRAIAVKPGYAEANCNLGVALMGLLRHEEAMACFENAIALTPDYAEAHNNKGVVLMKLDRPDEAMESYRRAIDIRSDYAEAYYNLGNAMKETGQPEDAIASYRRAIEIKPGYTDAHNNLGRVHQEQGRLDEATESCRRALAFNRDHTEALCTLGSLLEKQGRLDEGEDVCRRAIELKPDYAEAHANLALILLGKGLLKEAWDEYEWRWRIPENEQTARNYPQPRWDGTPIDGKRLLVWSEQGVGDEVRFASMIPDLVEANAHVVLETDPRLVSLFRRSFPDVSFIAKENPPSSEACSQTFDFQIPCGSLGQWFRNDINFFPDRRSYLVADAPRRNTIRERYQDGAGDLLVGIAWNSKNKELGGWKSLSLNEFHPLAEVPGIKLVDLQYGDTAEERAAFEEEGGHALIHDDEINQMADLDAFTAQVAALDLVVTISSATAHLAGALGIPTWVILDTAPLACWMMDRNDSPWYSSVKLIRQSRPGDWKGVIGRVVHELGKLLND